MQREDLGTTEAPPTLEDALRVPDLDDHDVVRSLWDGLAGEPPAVEPLPEPAPPEPVPEDLPAPVAPTRRQLKRDERAAKEQRKLEKLQLRRHRILPRTVIGIASMLLFFGLGAGVAGAALYAYYDWRLSENEQRVGELSEGLERRLAAANEGLENASQAAVDDIRREMGPFRDLLEQYRIATDLVGGLQGSVWAVETLDENGAASVGSAFVAGSDDAQSLLVTSYAVVAAGTTEPGPTITVRSGDESFEAELYNWDPEHDLALLLLPRGGLEAVPWAGDDDLSGIVGRHVWAAEGYAGNRVALSSGTVVDQNAAGLQHNAPLNDAFRGGPIVNGQGEVVGIASTAYQPLGYPGGAVSFGVPVQATCERVLSCSGEIPDAGQAD